jgi:hypothetical protein
VVRIISAVGALLLCGSAQAQTQSQPAETVVSGASIELQAVPGAPAGVVSAVLVGKLDQSGVYVLRNKWPANATLPPHTHGGRWRIYTVVDGEVHWGFGPKLDMAQTVRLGPGSVMTGPGDKPHYFVTGALGATLQIVAEGPFTTEFVEQSR